MIYDDSPEVPANLLDTYDILQQLGLEFLIGRYKGIYKQLIEGEGMTDLPPYYRPTVIRVLPVFSTYSLGLRPRSELCGRPSL
jgi:hypothetical protein